MKAIRLMAAVGLMFTALPAVGGGARVPIVERDLPGQPSLLFVADPQLHNMYGSGVGQMTSGADFTSRVAIRPPEVNLLAEHALRELVRQGMEGERPKAMVLLGDGTNIGCSAEFDELMGVLREANSKRVPLLMAHGNHDSYLMGTVNSYGPTEVSAYEAAPGEFIVDDSWWPAWAEGEYPKRKWGLTREHTWRNACYRAGYPDAADGELSASARHRQSQPLSKLRWLAKYLAILQEQGLQVVRQGSDRSGVAPGVRPVVQFASEVKPGSFLASLNYRLIGRWYRPDFKGTAKDSDLQRVWKSFVVQSMDLGPSNRVIIIDTSVCELARGGLHLSKGFYGSNAGSYGCLGDEQLAAIQQLLDQTDNSMGVTFMGHFPLADIKASDREELRRLMAVRGKWTYVSAHTHHAFAELPRPDGLELNIGSTTDWPIEAQKMSFAPDGTASGRRPLSLQPLIKGITAAPYWPRLTYQAPAYDLRAEVCRHLPAAHKLADAEPGDFGRYWWSPAPMMTCRLDSAGEWLKRSQELDGLRQRIRERMTNPEYARAVFGVLAAAAKRESEQFHLLQFMEGTR